MARAILAHCLRKCRRGEAVKRSHFDDETRLDQRTSARRKPLHLVLSGGSIGDPTTSRAQAFEVWPGERVLAQIGQVSVSVNSCDGSG
jgi:hypothetical protein